MPRWSIAEWTSARPSLRASCWRARLIRLIDLIDPAESYSAARFIADANVAMKEIAADGDAALLVGGTMLYFRALQSGLAKLPAADPEIRRRLEARARQEGWQALHAELARLDPASAARIRPGDRQRIQRALEVIERSGRPLSALARRGPAWRRHMTETCAS